MYLVSPPDPPTLISEEYVVASSIFPIVTESPGPPRGHHIPISSQIHRYNPYTPLQGDRITPYIPLSAFGGALHCLLGFRGGATETNNNCGIEVKKPGLKKPGLKFFFVSSGFRVYVVYELDRVCRIYEVNRIYRAHRV